MRRRVLRALAAAAFYLALWGALALLLRSQGRSLLLPGPAQSEPAPRPLRLLAVQAVRGINGFICRSLCPGCEIRSEYEQPNRCALCQFRPVPAPGTALLLLPGGD